MARRLFRLTTPKARAAYGVNALEKLGFQPGTLAGFMDESASRVQ
jgi:hypothetical protein